MQLELGTRVECIVYDVETFDPRKICGTVAEYNAKRKWYEIKGDGGENVILPEENIESIKVL